MEAEESGLLGELGGGEGVAAIERGIRDLAGKVMANPDVQNLGDSIRTGAMKVSLPACWHSWRLAKRNSCFIV
jgi:ADP-ribosylation factor GTPase-activating protein 2/3